MATSPPSLEAFAHSLGFPLQFVAIHPETRKITVKRAKDNAHLAEVVQEMGQLNANGCNIYYEVNASTRQGQRSGAQHISHLRAIVGDADAKDGQTILGCLTSAATLPMPPSYTLMTGGGVQVVYLLASPIPVTPQAADLYERIGKALKDRIDGDSVFDMPRIMRAPCFMNYPDAKKRAAGRTPCMAVVEEDACLRRYTLDELEQAFATPKALGTNTTFPTSSSTAHWFERLSPADKDACLEEMLAVPSVVALADTSDADPSPNWRNIVAASARSGAPAAYDLCRAWAQTSPRFDPVDFDIRWRSYSDG